ncbi:MAG TPA: hypothetical protein EYG89_05575 [Bacteroidia bacterium]|nr:hypothetical protein [Bacteroidia bacterium]
MYSGEAEVDLIEGVRPPEYFGITEMLNENIIENLPDNFKSLQNHGSKDDPFYAIHPKVEEYVLFLKKFDNGLGIIRESNTKRALELRNLLKENHKKDCDIIAIGSDSDCDFNINEGIKEVKNLVIKRNKRVVLIIVQALSAGKDLGLLKENIRFGIEPRSSQLANGSQGITGRFCGYHNNRNFKVLANYSLLEHYAKFEQDPEVFVEENWRNELFNQGVKGLTTQTRFENIQKEGIYIPILDVKTIDVNDLEIKESRELLNFIDNHGFTRLLSLFKESYYNTSTKGMRFNQKGVTVRIASGYNQNSNRVYKNWNCNINDDFGNVFFKKNQYEFGILISNYPVSDERNTLGFCGIKIIRSGEKEWREQQTSVFNASMYCSN